MGSLGTELAVYTGNIQYYAQFEYFKVLRDSESVGLVVRTWLKRPQGSYMPISPLIALPLLGG